MSGGNSTRCSPSPHAADSTHKKGHRHASVRCQRNGHCMPCCQHALLAEGLCLCSPPRLMWLTSWLPNLRRWPQFSCSTGLWSAQATRTDRVLICVHELAGSAPHTTRARCEQKPLRSPSLWGPTTRRQVQSSGCADLDTDTTLCHKPLTWFCVQLEVHTVHVRELPLEQVGVGARDVRVVKGLQEDQVMQDLLRCRHPDRSVPHCRWEQPSDSRSTADGARRRR
jgi:hypothetical protein